MKLSALIADLDNLLQSHGDMETYWYGPTGENHPDLSVTELHPGRGPVLLLTPGAASDDPMTQIAVHRGKAPGSLDVFAWCVTCNAHENGSASFARGSHGLTELIHAARQHLASDQHTGRETDNFDDSTPDRSEDLARDDRERSM